MPRELRITAVIALPEDAFDEADMLTKMRPVLETLRASMPDSGAVTHEIVTPRPRAEKTASEG